MQENPMDTIELLPVMFRPLGVGDAVNSDDNAGTAQMFRIADDLCRVYRDRQKVEKRAADILGEAFWRLVLAVSCRNRENPVRGLRVGIYAALLADAIGCPAIYCDDLQQAAMLRDIGMIGLQELFGEAPHILSQSEVALRQSHTHLGFEMLGGGHIAEFSLAAEVALGHHERYDGTGYPDKLQGSGIPLSARIVAVAEYFERLTSERDVRLPLADEDVANLVSSQWGCRFDPQLVVALLEIREVLRRVRQVYGEESIMLGDAAPARDIWRQFKQSCVTGSPLVATES